MGANSSRHAFGTRSYARVAAYVSFAVFVGAFPLNKRLAGQTQEKLRQAVQLQSRGQLQAAAEAYEAALSGASERNPKALAALGGVYLRLGRPAVAAARLEEALRLRA